MDLDNSVIRDELYSDYKFNYCLLYTSDNEDE